MSMSPLDASWGSPARGSTAVPPATRVFGPRNYRYCAEHFRLAEAVPTVYLAASDTKNGKAANQPLPQPVADALGQFLADKQPGQPVWPGTWWQVAAKMLRIDLEAAGIAEVSDGPEGTVHVDFHCRRHTMVHLLDVAGVSLKQAMQLARHSDPKVTMARYGRAQLHDLGESVARLPNLVDGPYLSDPMRATGTDGAVSGFAPRLVPVVAISCDSTRPDDNAHQTVTVGCHLQQTAKNTGFESDCERMIADEESTPGRTRTCDQRFRKPLLYPLSYGGK